MKCKLILIITILLSLQCVMLANEWEIGFKIYDSNGFKSGVKIHVYSMDVITKQVEYLGEATTSSTIISDCNAHFDQFNGT